MAQVEISTRKATEEDFNQPSRHIEVKLELYFNGLDNTPVEVTDHNHLMNFDLLEEICADGDKPFGTVSSNEISFGLYNQNGMFSPTNKKSPYYGKIKTGVPIRAYMRPVQKKVDIEWEPLGLFFVTDWSAQVTSITAEVTANDAMYQIFSYPSVKLPVGNNITFKEFAEQFFKAIHFTASVDESLTETLLYSYNTQANKEFLNTFAEGAQAYIFCNRQGNPRVEYARGPQQIMHTLTDKDQIISIDAKQSVLTQYTGAEVVMNKPQESNPQVLLNIQQLALPAGQSVNKAVAFSDTPVYRLTATKLVGGNVRLDSIEASSLDVTFDILNGTEEEIIASLDVIGTYIQTVDVTYADVADKLLSVNNRYIQNEQYAQKFLRFLRAYVANQVPVLELQIRGNPMYLPGEKLRVYSEKYNVDFEGILVRQQYTYTGGLSSTIKLFNSQIMEVI